MIESTYVETNEKYHRGLALDDYNGVWSIVGANKGADGKTYLLWVFPQVKDRKPSEKSVPLKIELGDQHDAIKRLEAMLAFLKGKAGVQDDYGPVGGSSDDDPSIPF